MLKKNSFGWPIVMVISFLPVLLWFLRPVPRFSNFMEMMANFGQLSGLVGMAMFSVAMFLSARSHFLEKYFNGLNKVYIKHNLLGQIGFILMLIHPLFLLPKYSGGLPSKSVNFLWLGSFWPKNWGVVSLIILIILIVFTLYWRPKYNVWKWTHKFMGLAFLFAVAHTWLIPSDTSAYLPLRIYMLFLSGVALAAFVYYSILGKFFIKKYKYVVSGKKLFNGFATEITMEPVGERIKFIPGQYIFVSIFDKAVGSESHPFSIISGPEEKNISFTAKVLGDYTANLKNISVGSKAKIEGPFGVFSCKKAQNKKQIWIAGGIGVTPFLSMIKDLNPLEPYEIDFYYCLKDESEAIYLDLFREKSIELPKNFRVFAFYSKIQGRISVEAIEKMSGGLENKDIFVCASPFMMESLRKGFSARGVKRKLIHSEEFGF